MTRRKNLYVGFLPGLKLPCLYVEDGCEVRVLARFVSEDAMLEVLDFKPVYTPQPTTPFRSTSPWATGTS